MSNRLSPGTVINNEVISTRVSEGEGWQIWRTSGGCYVLAADEVLLKNWRDYSDNVEALFAPLAKNGATGADSAADASDAGAAASDLAGVQIFCAAEGRLVASLDKGPYPNRREQIDDFTDAFCDLLDDYPYADLRGAVYIEEEGLLLPVRPEGYSSDNGRVYGKWITRGVNVSIEDIAAVHRLTSWLPESALRRYAGRISKYLNTQPGGGLRAMQQEERSADESGNGEQFAGTEVRRDDAEGGFARRKEEIPEEDFSLPGSIKIEKFFNEEIVEIIRHADEYKRMGIGFPGAVVLYGPPGTGKTFAVERLAEYLGWPRYDINSDSVGSTYIHETGMKIARIFDMAISNAPSIVVIDEMEAYLTSRSGSAHQHHVEEVSEFLRKIPEAAEKNVLVFGMTNMIKDIDPAILRRGRFDHMIEVGFADRNDIRVLLEAKKKEIPIDDAADLNKVAGELAGRPMSDVAFVLKEAGRYAVKNREKTITTAAFMDALGKLPDAKKERRAIGFSV